MASLYHEQLLVTMSQMQISSLSVDSLQWTFWRSGFLWSVWQWTGSPMSQVCCYVIDEATRPLALGNAVTAVW